MSNPSSSWLNYFLLFLDLQECANFEIMVKVEQEMSYHRWEKAAGVDEADLKSRLLLQRKAGGVCSLIVRAS
jgi:hypothetical protein